MSRFVSAALVGAALLVSGNAFAANAAFGKATYEAHCVLCHKTGSLGAPKVGDKAAWAPHINKGMVVMVANSITGYKGPKGTMPARGHAQLSDQQIGDAVAYMVSQSR